MKNLHIYRKTYMRQKAKIIHIYIESQTVKLFLYSKTVEDLDMETVDFQGEGFLI